MSTPPEPLTYHPGRFRPYPIRDSNNPLNFKYIYTAAHLHFQAVLDHLYPDIDMDLRLRQITHICSSDFDVARAFVMASGKQDRAEWLILLGYLLSFFEKYHIRGKLATYRARRAKESFANWSDPDDPERPADWPEGPEGGRSSRSAMM